MNYLMLEEFAAECERLAEEKETEREWLSDFANLVLEEAAMESAERFLKEAIAAYERFERGE